MEALNRRIAESGIKKCVIANKLGISKQSLTNKLKGKTSFTVEESFKISDILSLSDNEFFSFFALKDDGR